MQQNGAMFNGAMNILYQNLIVSNRKWRGYTFFQISRKKFLFTASSSAFGSFDRTTQIIIKKHHENVKFWKIRLLFLKSTSF